MLSESARASAAAEARFRIDAPNSLPRASRIIALDAAGERSLRGVAGRPWNGARFLTFGSNVPAAAGLGALPIDATLVDAEGREVLLGRELDSADLVVMIAGPDADADAAAAIGNACSVRGIAAIGLVVAAGGGDVERTLKTLRPHAAMLVVAAGEEYIPEMLTALRA